MDGGTLVVPGRHRQRLLQLRGWRFLRRQVHGGRARRRHRVGVDGRDDGVLEIHLRGHLFSFVRCPRVKKPLLLPPFWPPDLTPVLNLDRAVSIYFPLSVDLTDPDRAAAA